MEYQAGMQTRGKLFCRVLADQAKPYPGQAGGAGHETECRFHKKRRNKNDVSTHTLHSRALPPPDRNDFLHTLAP